VGVAMQPLRPWMRLQLLDCWECWWGATLANVPASLTDDWALATWLNLVQPTRVQSVGTAPQRSFRTKRLS
jgi:hypothetical protein